MPVIVYIDVFMNEQRVCLCGLWLQQQEEEKKKKKKKELLLSLCQAQKSA